MNKRTFLKTSSVLVTGSVLSPLMKFSNDEPRTNWAGNFKYTAKQYFQPKTLAEAQHLVAKTPILRGLGSRHSFNSIADSSEVQISLKELHQVVSLDKAQQQVTVEGGVTYGQVCQQLHQNGFALHNLASLPHISVAGACATATHGSGIKNGNLATSVAALEVIDAKGNLVVFSKEKNREEFNGAVVGLGGLGLISKVTLDLLPTFNMTQVVYQNMPMKALESNFDAVVASGYSVSLFTDWQNQRINQVWIKSKADGIQSASSAPELLGATLAHKHLHPLEDLSPENCTEQMGKIGPWYERMPHFKMGFTPSSGKELQSEYFLPIEHAYHAMMALEKLHEKVSPHLFISEIRTIAADDLWMSPCLGQPCVAFHFTWKQDWPAVKALLPLIEAQLAPFNARPHWGKLFTMPPQKLQSLIKKLPEFKELLATYDPKGKFRNSFLNHNLYTK
jgi:xylitol oxidase